MENHESDNFSEKITQSMKNHETNKFFEEEGQKIKDKIKQENKFFINADVIWVN